MDGSKLDFALVTAERLRKEPQAALLNEHRHLHGLAKLGEVDCAELGKIHKLVVDEMIRRGLEHDSPLECKVKAGLKLNEPHAYLVWKGKKRSIALPAEDGKGLDGYLTGTPLVLCQNGAAGAEAYGEVVLGNPAAMTTAQFDLPEYADCHCVRPEERREWWDGVKQFYVYPIKSFAKYEHPRPVLLASGCKCYLPDVQFKQYTPPTAKEQEVLRQSERLPKQIILTPRAVSLTGSMLYGNHDPRDVDMVVVGAEWREDEGQFVVPLTPTFKEKLERVLRAVYQTGNAVQYISEGEGPTFDHLPLYALALVRLPRLEVEHVSEMEPEMAEVGYDKDGAKGIRPAFRSPGGKRQLAHEIADLIPDCKTYVEPCVGGGAVFFAREPSGKEILGDLDSEIIRAYKSIKNLSDEDIAWLGKQDWKATKSRFEKLSEQPDSGRKEGLYRFLYMVAYSKGDRKSYRHWYDGDKIAIADRLPDLRERLKDVELVSGDYEKLVKQHDGLDTFFYFDPPYPNTSNLSEFNFDAERFETVLKGIKGKAIVSWSPKSPKLDLSGWHTKRVIVSRSDEDRSSDSELLLMNFSGTKSLTVSALTRTLRGASPTTRRQALQSYTDDAVLPGRPFVPLKPMRPAAESQRQLFSRFNDFAKVQDHWPLLVSAKRDGVRHTVHRKGGHIWIYSDDGIDNAAKLPELVERFKCVPGDWILDCELEFWKANQHYPREAAAGAVHSGRGTENLVANIFAVVYWDGKDLHKVPFTETLPILKKLPVDTTSDHPLDPKKGRLNLIPQIETGEADFEKTCMKTAYLPGVEGVVVRRPDLQNYPLDGDPGDPPCLFKWHKNSAFTVIALARTETATPGVYNYTYGLPAGDLKPKTPFKLNGKTYLVIGKTFSTTDKIEPGSEFTIEAETVNLTTDEDTGETDVSFWVPNYIKQDQKDVEDWRV